MSRYRDGLLNDVIPFWLRHGVDQQCGGMLTCLDRDGAVVDTDKGVWQQGRAGWMFAKLYNDVEPREEWLQVASTAVKFLENHCIDARDGRMWFHVTRDGRPIRKRRYAYSEAFAAMAYGEMHKATGNEHFKRKAEHAFHMFTEHNLHPRGVEPKFTDTRPTRSLGFPMISLNVAQELRNSIGFNEAENWIERSLEDIQRYHLRSDEQCVLETVGIDGEIIDHFDGRTLNPGHAIEAAWFIMMEARYRQENKLIQLGCQILDWMWGRGWDPEHGGVLYFVDLRGKPVQEYWHDMKFWWPQCETMIATLLAWSMTREARYLQWHRQIHEWVYQHFPDPEFGEWFGYLHRDGRISVSLKGNLWKGPFHLPRMLLTCWQILDQSQ